MKDIFVESEIKIYLLEDTLFNIGFKEYAQ